MGAGWVRGRELRRRMNAGAPRRWSALGFYRLLRRLMRWGIVEVRLEAAVVSDTPGRTLAFRVAMVETAEGPVPALLMAMRQVWREEYEERTTRLAQAHLRRHLRGADPEP